MPGRNHGFPAWLAAVLLSLVPLGVGAQYSVIDAGNPTCYPNVVFKAFENLNATWVGQIKSRYGLDTVVAGETDEFKRILLLRDWIRKTMPVCTPYMTSNSAFVLLDAALAGGNCFQCGEFMVVQNAVYNAYGYLTRCLGAGPGVRNVRDGHHGINEVWVNSLRKWVLIDGKYNNHFEKNGIPLSALEVRDEYLKNQAADIDMVCTSARTPQPKDTTSLYAQTYTWVEWEAYGNRQTVVPANRTELLLMYADTYFNTHTWYWDGNPHWAYGTPYLQEVTDRNQLEWTPNTLSLSTQINGNSATAGITSSTPNLKTYQMRVYPSGAWQAVPNSVALTLTDPVHEWRFRAVNLMDVAGPEYSLMIALPGQITFRPSAGSDTHAWIRGVHAMPGRVVFDIASNDPAGSEMRVLDITGKKVWSCSLSPFRGQDRLLWKPMTGPGIYFAGLESWGERSLVRFVVH